MQPCTHWTAYYKKDLGTKGLCTLQGVSAKVCVDQNVQPRLHSPRPVPFALHNKVEQELERLQMVVVIKAIQLSDWAASIVPVLKDEGDYKVTMFTSIRSPKYHFTRSHRTM